MHKPSTVTIMFIAMVAEMALLLVIAAMSAKIFFSIDSCIPGQVKVEAQSKPVNWQINMIKSIQYDPDWIEEDGIMPYSRCWMHWVRDDDGQLVARDQAFCIPD